MKFRASLAFVLIAAASACTASDSSTGLTGPDVGGPAFETSRGVKPPPPLGTEDTEIAISVQVEDEVPTGDFNAAADHGDEFFNGVAAGRYFANTQSTNGWIQFETNESVIASQGARLAYNEKQDRTNGHGTLIDSDGTVLDLALVKIIGGSFGACAGDDAPSSICANLQILYDGEFIGTIVVALPDTEVPVPVITAGDRN
jgi:hypothetical protein